MLAELAHVSRLFSLGGMSECGKSEAGRFFADRGVERLKIARFIEVIASSRGYDLSGDDYTDQLFEVDADGTLAEFVRLVGSHMGGAGIRCASLESMYRVSMATHLKAVLGDRMVNIYIDAPFDVRVEREWAKSGKDSSVRDVERRVAEKDEMKARIGVPGLRDVADIVIDNSGTLEEYQCRLGDIVMEYCGDVGG